MIKAFLQILLIVLLATSSSSAGLVIKSSTPSFLCGTSTVQDADGNSYDTVSVNGRCWIVGTLKPGVMLQHLTDEPSDDGITNKWCYSDNEANCATGGGLYVISEAMKYTYTFKNRGICPSGWHIPTQSDFDSLLLAGLVGEEICDIETYSNGFGCTTSGDYLLAGGGSGLNIPKSGYAIRNQYAHSYLGGGEAVTLMCSGVSQNTSGIQIDCSSNPCVVNPFIASTNAISVTCMKDYESPASVVIRLVAGQHGHIDGNTTQHVAPGGTTTPVEAVGDTGEVTYGLYSWSDGHQNAYRVYGPVSDNNDTITAIFRRTYSLTYNAGDHGTISDGPWQQTVVEGKDSSPVTITPDAGYEFTGWDDSVSDNPRIDYAVSGDISVTALYNPIEYFMTYFVMNSEGGQVQDELGSDISGTPISVFSDGCGQPVTAVPDSGYVFSMWNDESTDNPRQDCYLLSNSEVSAIFVSE